MGILDSDEKYKNIDEEIIEPVKIPTVKLILSSFWFQLGVLFLLTGVLVPIILFQFVYETKSKPGGLDTDTCNVLDSYRMPCGNSNFTEFECKEVNCCFEFRNGAGCYHTIPTRYFYVMNTASKKVTPNLSKTPFKTPNYNEITITAQEISKHYLQISLFYGKARNKAPKNTSIADAMYNYTIYSKRYGIEVQRMHTGETILTTLNGPTIASNGYWEWTVQLTNDTLFGLGKLNIEGNETHVFYSNQENHHNAPTLIAYKNGKYHGMHIVSNNLLEITVLKSKMLILKSLKSVNNVDSVFTLHIAMGPTPKDVIQQLRSLQSAVLPIMPYWALGIHICRDSNNIPSVSEVLKENNEFRDKAQKKQEGEIHRLPYDSECIHENIFGLTNNYTDDDEKKLSEYIVRINDDKKRFIMSLSPQVEIKPSLEYGRILKDDVLYKDRNCSIVNGKYLGLRVAYPNFAIKTENWLPGTLRKIPGFNEANGFILRNNWPLNEDYVLPNTTVENKQFHYMNERINKSLSYTIPWDATLDCDHQSHMEVHNRYGTEFTRAIENCMITQKSSTKEMILLTASNDISADHAFGVHAQYINATWANLKWSVVHSIFHNLFGNPLVSVPVCGSTENFDDNIYEELCIRWYISAATLPLFRISSLEPRRDPFNLPSKFAEDIAIDAIRKRYSFVPYFYSIMKNQEPMVTPMFYHYHEDSNTFGLDEQYMIGDALLIRQIFYPKLYQLMIYLPVNTIWYEYWTGAQEERIGWVKLFVIQTDWIIYISGGHIIPIHDFNNVGNSVEETRSLPITLAVALKCTDVEENGFINNSTRNERRVCSSDGEWNIGNDVYLKFTSTDTTLTLKNVIAAKDVVCSDVVKFSHVISTIKVYGLNILSFQDFIVNVDLCDLTVDVYDIRFVNDVL